MQNKKWFVWGAVVLSITGLLAAVLAVQLWKLQMIPAKYLIPFTLVLVLIVAVLGVFLLRKQGKYQNKVSHTAQIAALAAAGLCSVGFVLGISAAAKLAGTMSAVTDAPAVSGDSVVVDAYVRATDPADSLADTAQYMWGYCNAAEEEIMARALDALQQDLGRKPGTKVFTSETEMINSLYSGEIQGILLNNAYGQILASLEGYEDFDRRVRLVARYTLENTPTQPPVETEPQSPETQPAETQPPKQDTLVVYLSGSDVRAKDLTKYRGRSDVNILLVANLDTREILLLNTPRDYYVPNHAYGDKEDKLTHCGINGVDNSIHALQKLYDVRIPYYAQINFAGFETLINALGGITIESDSSFKTVDPGGVYIQKGINYLDGHAALAYARERHAFASGDLARGEHQMQVIRAVIDKLSSGSILTGYYDIMDSLKGMFLTTIPQARIAELVKLQLDEMPQWHISSFGVSGQLVYRTTATSGGLGLSVILPDDGMVQHGQMLIDKVLEGETLTQQDLVYE